MSQLLEDVQNRLAKIAAQQQDLLTEFAAALAAGDTARQADIHKKIARLTAEMGRLGDEQRYAKTFDSAPLSQPKSRIIGKTTREHVLDVLDEIGVALSPSTISDFIKAMTDVDIPPSRFASLRRDEERSAQRNITSRPAWVVPALSTNRYNPVPRLLTSSAWEIDRRLIGARSMRVNHLYITLAFLDRFDRLQANHAPQTVAIQSLVVRYARGIPGAIVSGSPFNPEEIRAVITAELSMIDEYDKKERYAAAVKISQYSDQHKLWGLPVVIDGGSQHGTTGK